MTSLCTTILADAGVLGSIDVQDFQLGFIPLDKEVLSLEYEDVYKRIYLVNHTTPILLLKGSGQSSRTFRSRVEKGQRHGTCL